MEHKFEIGDTVMVIKIGAYYPDYSIFPGISGVTNWKPGEPPKMDLAVVVNYDKHRHTDETLFVIQQHNQSYIIGGNGLVFVNNDASYNKTTEEEINYKTRWETLARTTKKLMNMNKELREENANLMMYIVSLTMVWPK